MNTIINTIQETMLSEGQMPIGFYLLINICIFLFLSVIYSIYHFFKKRHMEKLYMEAWEQSFDGNFRTTLNEVRGKCKNNKTVNQAVHKALFYLDHSICRDYEGAIRCLDRTLESKKIKKMHQEYLKKIKVICLIPEKHKDTDQMQTN